ncbi:MAG: TIGR03862 family flavoprotein [Alphaproteobacteria bacterium]|nr:TIGR03862 family flavoprotein [Alphaproteobacteria bacterium]
MNPNTPDIAVIGAGPAGLFAAEYLSARGHKVRVFDRMPTPGRKFLMAGRGGLNLTHSEGLDAFLSRYRPANPRVEAAIRAFPPAALRNWCEELGQETFVGSSGRVFPKAMKASPLLRAWRGRLDAHGVDLALRHDWTGWDGQGALTFETPDGPVSVRPSATLLALGGASWPRLGSDGGWAGMLADRGVPISPFQPSNSGFMVDWSPTFGERFAGTPLKHITVSFGGRDVTGDAMISAYGIEGGAIYALSGEVRDALGSGRVTLHLDLRPGVSPAALSERLTNARKGESIANRLRKAAGLSPVSASLLREAVHPLPTDPGMLAMLIKACPVELTGVSGLARAISSAGGIRFDALDDGLMLKALPGVFAAGEMLDWEAPTGGYLLQACFATGLAAARGVERYLSDR